MSRTNCHKSTHSSNVSGQLNAPGRVRAISPLHPFACAFATVSNVASYGFLKKRLETHDLHIHALWFDIYTGDIYFFSRGQKRFVPVDETSCDSIVEEIRRFYS